MAALDTVANYVSSARTLLQDATSPYRYSDADLVLALNLGVYEARKARPDLFIGRNDNLPNYTTNDSTAVSFDKQYRLALLYFVIGYAQLRDEEATQDARAAALLTSFRTMLLGQL